MTTKNIWLKLNILANIRGGECAYWSLCVYFYSRKPKINANLCSQSLLFKATLSLKQSMKLSALTAVLPQLPPRSWMRSRQGERGRRRHFCGGSRSPSPSRIFTGKRSGFIHFSGKRLAARTVTKDGLTKDSNHCGPFFRSGFIFRVYGDYQAHPAAKQRCL